MWFDWRRWLPNLTTRWLLSLLFWGPSFSCLALSSLSPLSHPKLQRYEEWPRSLKARGDLEFRLGWRTGECMRTLICRVGGCGNQNSLLWQPSSLGHYQSICASCPARISFIFSFISLPRQLPGLCWTGIEVIWKGHKVPSLLVEFGGWVVFTP